MLKLNHTMEQFFFFFLSFFALFLLYNIFAVEFLLPVGALLTIETQA